MIKKILVVTFLSKDEEKGGNKETKAVMLSHTQPVSPPKNSSQLLFILGNQRSKGTPMKNKLAKLEATLVETTTSRVIGVKCKATSIAEKALLKWALFKLPKFSSEKVLKTFGYLWPSEEWGGVQQFSVNSQ